MNHLITVTKADGTRELFEEQKLVDSLRNAGGNEEIIDKILEHIGREIKDGMTTGHIYSHAFKLLRQYSMPIAIKYSLRRALSELGPDGFPFEKFISSIFNAWGYETLTDQTVFGGCVPHEMDVVAWKGDDLVMVEAKFHNEFGLKSDLKVALYVKARFDDLKENTFEYGGKKLHLKQGYIITNTKFTDQAIRYSECNGIKLIGWNFPAKGNLQDIIEELRLHPSTCLASLSNAHKKALLAKGVVLCKEILEHKNYLHEIGMTPQEISSVENEIAEVMGV